MFTEKTHYVGLEEYQHIELFGKPALFTNDRLKARDIPEGLYCYHLRHSDDGSRFSSIEPKASVNHGGSVIMNEPLDFGKDRYIALSEDTEPNFLGEDLTLGEFMRGDFKQSQDKGMHM